MSPAQLQKIVLKHYRRHGRDFPWRRTTDPYRILISEVMLQQTQTDRVVPYFKNFLRRFPTFSSLATAKLRDVLRVWNGLGYNRRALYLKRTAEIVVRDYSGRLPSSPDILQTLPGIGPYTANAIACFAFNEPTVFIETNIRTVMLHNFFPLPRRGKIKMGDQKISDTQLLPLIQKTLDVQNPSRWYYALMDYGAHLKKTLGANPGRRSAHYVRQSPFEGSRRQLRGEIILRLTEVGRMKFDAHFKSIIAGLERDGLIMREGRWIRLA